MIIPRIRKKGEKDVKVKRCPKCKAPLLNPDIYRKEGGFCRKCGHFIEPGRDKEDYTGYQFQNME
jgi:uncharacterized paraquat-inducible protein A